MQMKICKNYQEYLNDNTFDILNLIGGGNAGKSYFILEQKILLKFLMQEEKRILILRKVGTTVKRSVMQGVLDALNNASLKEDKHYRVNRHEKEIELKVNINGNKTKGNTILFSGLDDETKVKSYKGISDIVMEEASDFTESDYEELKIRLRDKDGTKPSKNKKQLILMSNPTDSSHWLEKFNNYEKVTMKFPDDDLEELAGTPKKWEYEEVEEIRTKEGLKKVTRTIKCMRVNYEDNEFLGDIEKATIESYKRTNYNKWKRYRLGLAEERKEKVFNEENSNITYREITEEEKKQGEYLYGLDFGFSSDPAALIEMVYIKNKNQLLITNEIIYSTGLTNKDIYNIIKEYQNVINSIITCDSAEPKSIEELKRLGLRVQPAEKGAGSIISGIKKMCDLEIVVNTKCTNLKNEFENYKYKIDKNGKITQIIVDDYNHGIDAIRYAIEKINKEIKIRIV